MGYKIAIADDHTLVAGAFQELLNQSGSYEVIYVANNGKVLLSYMESNGSEIDLVLLDINMPIMDGFETMEILHREYPDVKVLGLSMNDGEKVFIKLLNLGAHGFVSKSASREEFLKAINGVLSKGYYYTEEIVLALFKNKELGKHASAAILSQREIELLSYISTELTYKEIADRMCLSPKTIDGYRNSLFLKLGIKSRVGLAMYAVKNGYYSL